MRRSLLFVPGDSAHRLQKATELPADVLLPNLEDAIDLSAKVEARQTVCRFLEQLREQPGGSSKPTQEIFVRINSFSSGFGMDDLQALAPLGANILLPKVESAADMEEAEEHLGSMEKEAQLAEGAIRLLCMIESPRAILESKEIAESSSRIVGLVFGGEDYQRAVRCRPKRDESEWLFPRTQMVLAARAAGMDAFDTPILDLEDRERLESSSQRARALGFDGKCAIHPSQLEILNRVFSPTSEEIRWATEVISALEQSQKQRTGTALVQGRVVDLLHMTIAERILDDARRAGLL